ncbi:acyl carrier protein [Streptococcus sp. FT1-106]|uniref:acyl carrier protein n=1 Tax=Streptococcus sp. FT1-106 TaxID=3409994 RepID=UPI003BF53803
MTKEAIFERIVIIIKEQLHKPELDIKPSTTLQDDLGVDSISLMEFIISLEDEFGLDIPDEDVEDMMTMEEIMEYLYSRLLQK